MAKKKSTRNYEFVKTLLEDKGRRESIETLPCKIFEADGAFGFRFFYGDKPGIVALEYYSHGLADWALNRAKGLMRAITADKIAGQPNSDKALTREPSDEQAQFIATIVATVFIKGMSGKMSSLLGELERETECYMYEAAHKALPRDGKPQLNSVKQLAKEMAAERKHFLESSIAHFGEPRWAEMKGHYDALLPLAKKAKGVYENYKARDWRGMIKKGFPEFDDDLITLLSDDYDDLGTLPAGKTDNFSKPSDLALEQAARRCGMTPFQYTPRTLRDRMDGERSVKSTSERVSPGKTKARKGARKKRTPARLISTRAM